METIASHPILSKQIFHKQVALPQDHGSWVFLISPLLIGLFAGGRWTTTTPFIILAAFSAFLIRQPITMLVKIASKRRPPRELPAAIFWGCVYGVAGLGALAAILLQQSGYVLWLALPGIPVFAWHLFLVSRRSERRQLGIELVAGGVLALVTPAAMWVGRGNPDPVGWLLWGLCWAQSGASIVYAYLRLEQRELAAPPLVSDRLQMARPALLFTTSNLAIVIALAILRAVPPLLLIAFAVQWIESIWGSYHPAVGLKPVVIGARQTVVSTLFTVLFILAWVITKL